MLKTWSAVGNILHKQLLSPTLKYDLTPSALNNDVGDSYGIDLLNTKLKGLLHDGCNTEI
jgi:hypothetical protein